MASFVTNEAAKLISDGTLVWGTGTFKARLVASSATPTKDSAVMTGLTKIDDDVTLVGLSRVKDTTNDRVLNKATPPDWGAVASGEIGWVVFYLFVTDDADSVPIAVHEVSPAKTANGGNIDMTLPTIGAEANVVFYSRQ
jgi:hypothetical protein